MLFHVKIDVLAAMCGLDNENIIEDTTLNIEVM